MDPSCWSSSWLDRVSVGCGPSRPSWQERRGSPEAPLHHPVRAGPGTQAEHVALVDVGIVLPPVEGLHHVASLENERVKLWLALSGASNHPYLAREEEIPPCSGEGGGGP